METEGSRTPRARTWPWMLAVAALSVLLVGSLVSNAGASSVAVAPIAAPVPVAPAPTHEVVPNFAGLTVNQAVAAAAARGFTGLRFANDSMTSSRVVSQNPAAGASWRKSDPVEVTLASGAPAPSTPAYTPPPTTTTTTYTPPPTEWTYKVTGRNAASITYSSEDGGTSQETEADLPWSKKIDSPSFGGMSFAYVSAQNSGGGTISCQIIDPSGTVVAENSSSGEYAIVTCQD